MKKPFYKISQVIIASVLLAVALSAIVSWPVAEHFTSGIAISHRDPAGGIRGMVAGDHLQFLYHVWLAQDTFFGKTPFFYNIYEFNLGDDADLKNTAMRYYLPFSLFFSLGAAGGNQALGWNLMGVLSLWLTLLPAYLLLRRYTGNPLLAWLAAGFSIVFPFRIFTLLTGSPTGLAMMWIPVVYLGLDVMIRDRKMWGAFLAGASIVISRWCDLHVVFYAALTAPFWCLFAYVYERQARLVPTWYEVKAYLRAASPLIFFAFLMFLEAHITLVNLETSELDGGMRTIPEVAINSPRIRDMVSLAFSGVGNHVYIGYLTLTLVLCAYLALVVRFIRRRRENTRNMVAATLLMLAVMAILTLALGVNMPGGATSWRILTTLVPFYDKIRQPAKIFSLLPCILSVLLVLTIPYLLQFLKRSVWRNTVCIIIFALLIADYATFTKPAICELDQEQGAYAAIAADARDRKVPAHMIAIPLWPGNSHWTSLNQYYVSLYRIKMVNGYAATPDRGYQQAITPFASFNNGDFADRELDSLLSKGVGYILLQGFPGKVSPFAVLNTLNAMLNHPRIDFLKQDRTAWAFSILPAQGGGKEALIPGAEYRFPSRVWQVERGAAPGVRMMDSADASGNRYACITGKEDSVGLPATSASWIEGLCYFVRLKSRGACELKIAVDEDVLTSEVIASQDGEWRWHTLEVPRYKGYRRLQLTLQGVSGETDADLAILATTEWDPNALTEPLHIPAAAFFHGGYIERRTGAVVFEPEREPEGVVLFGPNLPLPMGGYEVEIKFDTPAPNGTKLGVLRSRYPHGKADPVDVIAGKSAIMAYDQIKHLRMMLEFVYTRAAKVEIKTLTIRPKTDK